MPQDDKKRHSNPFSILQVMPIENRMEKPQFFITWNGVLNSSCLVVLAIFAVTGFYGYLSFGEDVKETVTLNLPQEP